MMQDGLLDPNLHKVIARCYINNRRPDSSEVFVIYADDTRERIWTFNPNRHTFDSREFTGKTKLEAIFYCDRKPPRSLILF